MAGKSVNRSRVQAFKFRFQRTDKAFRFQRTDKAGHFQRTDKAGHFQQPDKAVHLSESPVADGHSPTIAVQPVTTVTSSKKGRDRAQGKQAKAVRSRHHSHLATQVTQGLRFLAAPLVWFCLLAFCGGTGVAAFLWLTTLPPVANCQKLPPAAADTDQIYCAEQAARSGKVEAQLAGLKLVKPWSADHPLHIRATRAVKEWSKTLLTIAQTKADQGDVAGAIVLAKKIPANSPIHADVQTALLDWQQGQNRGQVIESAMQTALKQQDWETATVKLQALAKLDDKYAQQNLTRWRQQLATERIAFQQLQQARQVAEQNPENIAAIGQAIAQAERVDPSSYAHSQAQSDIQTWGQFLLNRLTEQLGQSDLAGAIATAQRLPLSLPLPPVARDLVWLSRAQPLAAAQFFTRSPFEQSQQLWVALAQVRQIRADSPLYPQAKSLLPRLEQQSEDILQIQMANSVANLKQILTLQAAIALMQTVAPDRPQRVYAQTLIAQWRKEIQQLEDRPYLIRAQQLAMAGTLPKLKAAIAQARQIAPKRALRLEAQSAIAKWTRQMQTIEDQPLLNQAKALAKQKKLKDAIQIATKISANRALYKEAQTAIGTWQAEIQSAEDQAILADARALADRGRLTNAISLADQIGYGRALHGEAQAAIARWSAQRDAIRSTRRPSRRYTSPSTPEPYRPAPEAPYEPPASAPAPPPELPPP
ncbi:MAG: hypothetical protein KME27_23655 [Lyngbya sp. HA4199-MV5]|jgi:hypothetical protein|nr:hypothetical protein [Lyngbya sp. HA4199-MV5]